MAPVCGPGPSSNVSATRRECARAGLALRCARRNAPDRVPPVHSRGDPAAVRHPVGADRHCAGGRCRTGRVVRPLRRHVPDDAAVGEAGGGGREGRQQRVGCRAPHVRRNRVGRDVHAVGAAVALDQREPAGPGDREAQPLVAHRPALLDDEAQRTTIPGCERLRRQRAPGPGSGARTSARSGRTRRRPRRAATAHRPHPGARPDVAASRAGRRESRRRRGRPQEGTRRRSSRGRPPSPRARDGRVRRRSKAHVAIVPGHPAGYPAFQPVPSQRSETRRIGRSRSGSGRSGNARCSPMPRKRSLTPAGETLTTGARGASV